MTNNLDEHIVNTGPPCQEASMYAFVTKALGLVSRPLGCLGLLLSFLFRRLASSDLDRSPLLLSPNMIGEFARNLSLLLAS